MTIAYSGESSTSPWPSPVELAHQQIAERRAADQPRDDELLTEDEAALDAAEYEEERGIDEWRAADYTGRPELALVERFADGDR